VPARPDLAAVILAAGRSSRMGTFKPLLPFGPESVIERIILTVRKAGVETIRVVVGWSADRLIPVLERHGVAYVSNDRFDEGMYVSIQSGCKASLPTWSLFFSCLGTCRWFKARRSPD